jgi:type IV pilus assembly protein PilM
MALGLIQKGQYALDIGGSSIVVVGVSGKPGGLKLHTYFEWPIPSGLVIDGEIAEPELFARELKTMVGRYKLRGRTVQLAVSNQKVIVRTIEMPDMTEEELAGAIQFQAQEYIPIPVDEVVLDSQVTGKRVDPDGSVRQEVLLVAGQRTMIATLLQAIRQSGLRVAGIDVSSLALVRALVPEAGYFAEGGEQGVCRGIADISSSVSTLVVAVEGAMRFTRIVNFSSDRFARVLADARDIPFEDAHIMVRRIGLKGPMPSDNEFYPDEVVRECQETLASVADELSEEIRRSFDYYEGQEAAARVAELILSGRGALVRNLDAYLSNSLGLPVVIGNPLMLISHNASGESDAELSSVAPCLSVAVGLAMPEEN